MSEVLVINVCQSQSSVKEARPLIGRSSFGFDLMMTLEAVGDSLALLSPCLVVSTTSYV